MWQVVFHALWVHGVLHGQLVPDAARTDLGLDTPVPEPLRVRRRLRKTGARGNTGP